MDVVTEGPLRAASVVWQPRAGAYVLTVVVAITYALASGESDLAAEQDDPCDDDEYWDDDDTRSLSAASDLVPFKPRVDVILVGQAYAPSDEPVTSLRVRLSIGAIDKAAHIVGDRSIGPDGAVSDPAPFLRMPLRWERAAGGPGTANPAGISPEPNPAGRTPLPNVLPATNASASAVSAASDAIAPIGFAPIAPSWPTRATLSGRRRGSATAPDWRRGPLPEGLFPGFFNAAPADQQLQELAGDEVLTLENLHPAHATFATRLRKVVPRASVEWTDGAPSLLEMRCDTVIIDTYTATCKLVWRGHVALDRREPPRRVLVSTGDAMAEPPRAASADPRGGMLGTTAETSFAVQPAPALPFHPAPLPPLPTPPNFGAPPPPEPPALVDAPPPLEPAPPAQHERANEAVLEPAPPPVRAAPQEVAPPLEEIATPDISIERFAAISAELAEQRGPRSEVLGAAGLDEAAWSRVTARWTQALAAESSRGGSTLRIASDGAWVDAVERFRGPIRADEFARLVVALERGAAIEALDALHIQRPALMPIVRTWTKKAATDVRLGGEVTAMLAKLRSASSS